MHGQKNITIAYVERKLFENKLRLFSVPGDLNCFQFNPPSARWSAAVRL